MFKGKGKGSCGCGGGRRGCGCGRSCDCKDEGGDSCGGVRPSGDLGGASQFPTYDGETWKSTIMSTTGWETTGRVFREVPEVCCCVPALGVFLCGEDVGGGRIWRRPVRHSDNNGTHYCGKDMDCALRGSLPLKPQRPLRVTWPPPCPIECLATATTLETQCSDRLPECQVGLGMYNLMCKFPYPTCPGIAPPPPLPPEKPARDPGYDPNIDWCNDLIFDQNDVGDDINYCCYLHDKCYDVGGNEEARTDCDQEFGGCIFRAAGILWSFPYFAAVSAFGSSHFNYTAPDEEGEMDRVFGSPWGRK